MAANASGMEKGEGQGHTILSNRHDPASFASDKSPIPRINQAAFAGRIGGNQEFVATDGELVKKVPDAVCTQASHNAVSHC
jgi:hypothetical protein